MSVSVITPVLRNVFTSASTRLSFRPVTNLPHQGRRVDPVKTRVDTGVQHPSITASLDGGALLLSDWSPVANMVASDLALSLPRVHHPRLLWTI